MDKRTRPMDRVLAQAASALTAFPAFWQAARAAKKNSRDHDAANAPMAHPAAVGLSGL
jgi:hypothetical protein